MKTEAIFHRTWALLSGGAVALALFGGALGDLSGAYGGVDTCNGVAGGRTVACDSTGACMAQHGECLTTGSLDVSCDDEGGSASAGCIGDANCTNMNDQSETAPCRSPS